MTVWIHQEFLFFFISANCIKTPKEAQKYTQTHNVYNGRPIASKRIGKTKTPPQSFPNQSIKSTKDIEVCSINKFV